MSVETFDAGWLTLREPVDHRSRPSDLAARLSVWWAARGATKVLDLGSGTGSNFRYLSGRLPGPQDWTLLDHDQALLERAMAEPTKASGGVRVTAVAGDLMNEGLAEVQSAGLVTASALLDLASEESVDALAEACASARCAALFALTYDGSVTWGPDVDAFDGQILAAINTHQRRDKGMGRALGPTAGTYTLEAFRRRGYETFTSASPWRLAHGDNVLARALLEGWRDAALEERPDQRDAIRAWSELRAADLQSPTLQLTVGHVDVLALPAGAPTGRR
jgi:SAM-dependent methyltransferase